MINEFQRKKSHKIYGFVRYRFPKNEFPEYKSPKNGYPR